MEVSYLGPCYFDLHLSSSSCFSCVAEKPLPHFSFTLHSFSFAPIIASLLFSLCIFLPTFVHHSCAIIVLCALLCHEFFPEFPSSLMCVDSKFHLISSFDNIHVIHLFIICFLLKPFL